LQKRLTRRITIYDGSKPDVLCIKLVFLRTLTLRHLDNDDRVDDDDDSEASNEDDHKIKSLLPIHSELFGKLSSLKLKENVPNRFPLPLLLRQECKVISELIQKEPPNSGGSVIG
jgi:hypothetical protein